MATKNSRFHANLAFADLLEAVRKVGYDRYWRGYWDAMATMNGVDTNIFGQVLSGYLAGLESFLRTFMVNPR